jgi:predicted NAD/FAD-binding protein
MSSRRDVLGALTGAAAWPAASPVSVTQRRRVGIVGGGMAGVALAWLLDGQYDVVLLEAQPSIGGNVQTVQLEVDGQVYGVDMGAQYFHPKLYPLYTGLLTLLGLYPPWLQHAHSFPASISLFAAADPFPRFVSPVFWDRLWPIFAPWNGDGLAAFANCFAAAKTREEQNGDWNLTLGAWLPTLGLQRHQWEGMLLPWVASLFTGDIEQARSFSARAAMIFAATSVPDSPTDPVLSYVLNRGMAEPLHRMVAQLDTVEILTRARVERIARQGGFVIRCADGRQRQVDDLVLASSGPASLRLLEGMSGTLAQQAALRGIEFETARIAAHTDPLYAPKDPNHRSFLNCRVHNHYCESSVWLAKVLTPSPPQTAVGLWKSWVTHRDRPPAKVLHESTFRHMVPTVASLRAQARLADLQGRDRIWVVGGYTFPFDSQETALVSALLAAFGLSATTARARMFPKG